MLSRRALLAQGGALVVTFALTSRPIHAEAARPADKTVAADEVAGFIAIDATGKVTIYSGKVELGTGAITAIAQIAAEELCVSLDRVTMIQGDTQLTPNQGPTYASLSIQDGGMQIRRAAATAREALLQRAADKLKVAKDSSDGPGWRGHIADRRRQAFVSATDRRATACDENRSRGAAEGPEGLHDRGHFRASPRHSRQRSSEPSTSSRTTSCRACCMRVSFIQPPSAQRSNFDDDACRKIQGYLRAVRKGNLLAVVATNEWAAISASTAIVATWSDWAGLPDEVAAFRVRAQLEGRPQRGAAEHRRTAAGRKPGNRTLQATYDLTMNTHGSIGPSCAVADFKDGRLTVWTPSQASHLLQAQLATMLSLQPENVRCIFVEGAGCYGRNGADDCSSEAAVIATDIGQPVRLQWMRQDEHGWDPKGPPVVLDYRADR